jgi:tetratricopeptide (TPR) repeat protein
MILVACLVTAGVAAPAGGADLPGPKQRWTELRTPNFTFFSHASERATRRIAVDLEELRAVLARFTTLKLNSPVPTYIYVFRNARDFNPYKMLYEGKPASVSGYFARRHHANYIAINGDSRIDASAIVYHEYVHYFVANNLPALPLWFEEGLSELYSSFQVSDRRIQLGLAEIGRVFRLHTSTLIPLEQLFAVDHGSPLYNESDRKGLFYAQSWALAHYLMIGSDERRPEVQRFVTMLAGGVPQHEAVGRAFNTDLAGLEKELRRYVDRGIYKYLEADVSIEVDLPITTERMTHADVLYRLGDLLVHLDQPRSEAPEHLHAAVQADPEHGPALAALGLLAEQHARWEEAYSYYRRALAAAPDDAVVQYRGGAYLLERGEDLDIARAALNRATELDPSFGLAWVDLARAYLLFGDFNDRALRAAENAHRLLPSRIDVARYVFRLYLATGRRGDALAIVEHGFVSNTAVQRRARAEVVRNDLARARQLVAEGHSADAAQILDDAEAAVLSAVGEDLLREQIEAVRGYIRERKATARYNEAVVAYNRGDLEVARQILLELQPDLPEGRQAEAVRSLLEAVDDPERGVVAETTVTFLSGIGPDDIERFNQLIANRDLEGARQLLDQLSRRANADEREWVDARIAEIESVFAYNVFVEQFNRAVDQYNDGAFRAAITTLEQLLAAQPDASYLDEARELLDDARAALKVPDR